MFYINNLIYQMKYILIGTSYFSMIKNETKLFFLINDFETIPRGIIMVLSAVCVPSHVTMLGYTLVGVGETRALPPGRRFPKKIKYLKHLNMEYIFQNTSIL